MLLLSLEIGRELSIQEHSHTVHDLVGGILQVPTDDLDPSMLLVGGEESEVLQSIQHCARLKHATVAFTC
jgi:hypothetical protein